MPAVHILQCLRINAESRSIRTPPDDLMSSTRTARRRLGLFFPSTSPSIDINTRLWLRRFQCQSFSSVRYVSFANSPCLQAPVDPAYSEHTTPHPHINFFLSALFSTQLYEPCSATHKNSDLTNNDFTLLWNGINRKNCNYVQMSSTM